MSDEAPPPQRRRRIVAAMGSGIEPAQRDSTMSRGEFMKWAAMTLSKRLGYPPSQPDNDNNVCFLLHQDVAIGVVATVRPTVPSSKSCIRVHISTANLRRYKRWESGWRPHGAAPPGTQLCFRVGDYGVVRYLEFMWVNHDLSRFQLWC